MKQISVRNFDSSTVRRVSAVLQAGVLALAALLPVMFANQASAAQMTARSATIDSSEVGAANNDVQFVFGFTNIDSAAAKQGIIYEFCTTPLGTCVLPTGMDVQTSNTDDAAQTGWPVNGTNFTAETEAADVGACTNLTNAYMVCSSRTEATTGGGAVTHTISGIVAPTAAQTVYIRISTFSDSAFASPLDTGTVAVAFVDQLTINGRVQERLNFCVAAIDDTDSVPLTVAACTALTDNNVDLGIIDELAPVKTPIDNASGNGADDDIGILMLNTNASAGAVVSYFPEADTGGTNETYSFRVDNATCVVAGSQPDETDQCFVDAINSGSGTTLSAGAEGFGVHIPCIEAPDTTAALGSVPAWYDADGTTTVGGPGNSDTNCESTDASYIFGWNESGVADVLASSSSAVDNEIIKLAFGASAAITTPSGEYTVVTTYIATVTF